MLSRECNIHRNQIGLLTRSPHRGQQSARV